MKRVLKMAAWILCAAALTAVLLRQTALSKVRSEHEMLRSQSEEARRLIRENAEMDRLRVDSNEIEGLRNETRELHKLRNEVRQLREQAKGLAQVQSENQRLKATVAARTNTPPGVAAPQTLTTLDQVAYLGLDTPEATLQSFLWAVRQEDVRVFRNCLTPERQKEIESVGEEQIRTKMREMKSQFKGFQIAAKKEISANEVQLGLQFSVENQPEQPKMAFPFKRINYEWKLDLDVTFF
jgi:hypothetical protein